MHWCQSIISVYGNIIKHPAWLQPTARPLAVLHIGYCIPLHLIRSEKETMTKYSGAWRSRYKTASAEPQTLRRHTVVVAWACYSELTKNLLFWSAWSTVSVGAKEIKIFFSAYRLYRNVGCDTSGNPPWFGFIIPRILRQRKRKQKSDYSKAMVEPLMGYQKYHRPIAEMLLCSVVLCSPQRSELFHALTSHKWSQNGYSQHFLV